MKVTLQTAHGFLSAQPPSPGNGQKVSWEYRPTAGAWESFDLDLGGTLPLVIPPVVVVPVVPKGTVSFDVPKGMNLDSTVQLQSFVLKGLMLAYGIATGDNINYWISHSDEMRQRGIELGMDPPERYYWERIIGRGSGGVSIALYGPYAGLDEFQGSLTPWEGPGPTL